MNRSSPQQIRKSERDVKLFVTFMTILIIIVAALTVGSYNGYSPNPSSVAITGFLLLLTVLITAVWYKTKYPGYIRAD
ncbi:hypothetical protein B9Q01_08485 [Candidatus Marsarchaeota G1 archaeon OSP_D]|jgi:hypothetical protein|uniref:Uncharacterized protein n=2 Tax=Candidatus Marsarchaeota group 1 TaxID=2203770 RepID=A0A2R6A7I5_9ARCH|nr:MAG: hypothetical protein B9Q01_08485 [Candidatus Marsarchaeota G1 archaeon OSP_D]PSN87757.1 MAG: hypothetical protein B9Q00_07835 [Candidatus Marsarchaeota G1 archaeon OSP_C]